MILPGRPESSADLPTAEPGVADLDPASAPGDLVEVGDTERSAIPRRVGASSSSVRPRKIGALAIGLMMAKNARSASPKWRAG
jgi:hypothetical protein